jgi:tetratricopeptide (TPR) repeat protein
MKLLSLPLFYIAMFMLTAGAFAQDKEKEQKIKAIGDSACECTFDIPTNIVKDSIVVKINSCITTNILVEQMKAQMGTPEKVINDAVAGGTDSINRNVVIYADENFDAIQQYMFENCPNIKELLSTNNVERKHSMSKNKKALKYYEEGTAYEVNENYDMAIVSYNKAVKEDPKFAFAWDNLGLCYRKKNNFSEAIRCYEKSLEIDPDGTMPMQNLAVAYDYLKEYKNAGLAYERIIAHDKKNPEGYYGAGRAFYFDGNLEKGVDYMFKAYVLYGEISSPYITDAQNNLGAFYKDLEEKGKLKIFKDAAKKNGVEIE